MIGIDESRLVQRAVLGDRLAFCVLTERYNEALVRYLTRVVGDHHTAQDLAQEVFLRAFRSLNQLMRARSFKPWLFRIAFHLGIDFLRRRTINHTSMNELGDCTDSTVPSRLGEDESGNRYGEQEGNAVALAAVNQAMGTLPQPTRHALEARYLGGLSCRQVAEKMGWSVANAKVRLHRGRRAVRRQLLRTAGHLFEDPLPSVPAARFDGAIPISKDVAAGSGWGARGNSYRARLRF